MYLTNWMMAIAKYRFKSGDRLLDVSLSLDYRSESGLSRVFKKALGVSPGGIRGIQK